MAQADPHADQDALVGFVDHAITALSSTQALCDYYAREISWLRARRAIWTTRTWRVGLLGITSSGKSTLVNALLGDRVLSARVRPSSNCLVVCRRGAMLGVAHFEDGSEKRFEGDRIKAELQRLADETTNPGNDLGVKEIELRWPGFLLDEDVALVDTPGLDAFGFDRHEELTMDLFLPTVDVVVFLTTAKANADGVIATYLDRIGDLGKPLVLVQNMVDSIEPKLGPGGQVERSREDVACDHLKRLRRLVGDRCSDRVRGAPILQVSAKLALDERIDESHIPDLVNAIQVHLAGIKPQLSRGRHEQILKELDELLRAEEQALSLPAESEERMRQDRQALRAVRTRLKEALEILGNGLESAKSNASTEGKSMRRKAKNLGPSDVSRARAIQSECGAWLQAVPTTFIVLWKGVLARVQDLARNLNLRPEDYVFEPPRASGQSGLRVRTETVTRPVPQRGFLGFLKRGLGSLLGKDWGTTVQTDEVLNCADFSSRVEAAVESQLVWANEAAGLVDRTMQEWAQRILDEIGRREQGIRQKQESVARAQERSGAVRQLKQLRAEIEGSRQSLHDQPIVQPADQPGVRDNVVDIEVPPFVEALVRLTDRRARLRYTDLRQFVLDRVAACHSGAEKRVLLWSFDAESLERFLGRFWSDLLQGPLMSGSVLECVEDLRIDGIPAFTAVGIGKEVHDGAKAPGLRAELERFLTAPSTVFLLLDAGQTGSTESQLRRSTVLKSLPSAAGLIVVVQSLAGLDIAESLVELLRVISDCGLQRPDAFLANHDDATLSVLVDRLAREGGRLRTHADEARWLAELGVDDPGRLQHCANILARWREINGQAKGDQ